MVRVAVPARVPATSQPLRSRVSFAGGHGDGVLRPEDGEATRRVAWQDLSARVTPGGARGEEGAGCGCDGSSTSSVSRSQGK